MSEKLKANLSRTNFQKNIVKKKMCHDFKDYFSGLGES